MKTCKWLFLFMVIALFGSGMALLDAMAPIPEVSQVFPGAEGFGVATPAGRKGQVLRVTTLKNSGPGSLRAALRASGPRVVVFEVAGTIPLQSALKIESPYITIAGQTAPSPGITLKGAGIEIRAHDVVVQHLRIRVGDEPEGPEPESRDAIAILEPAHNVIVDHVSASWAVDEIASVWGDVSDVTISHCMITESLNDSIHPKGPHSNGLLVGNGARNIALIGNLFAHNDDRNPRITGPASVVVVNNLMYNNRHQLLIGDPRGPAQVSVVGNMFIDGPVSGMNRKQIEVYPANSHAGTVVHHAMNELESTKEGTLWGYATSFDPTVKEPPIWNASIAIKHVAYVETSVLKNVGARPNDRDEVDQRVIESVRQRSGTIINSQEDVGGWPVMQKVTRNFIVPNDPDDDDDRDGYTNLEELLHAMARSVERTAPGTPNE